MSEAGDPLPGGSTSDVSAVVVCLNGLPWLERCLESVAAHETIVVDHGSVDGSLELVRDRFPDVQLIQQENLGMGAGNNAGMRVASSRYFLLLNSDAWMADGAVDRLVELADRRPDVAVVGPRLRNPDGTLQPSVRGFPSPWRISTEYFFLRKLAPGSQALNALYGAGFDHRSTRDVDWVSGACLFVRHAAADQVGYFDEDYFMFSEETDWCYRFHEAGWAVVFHPEAECVHVGGATHGGRLFRENVRGHLRFLAKRKGPDEAERARKLMLAALRFRGLVFGGERGRQYRDAAGWLASGNVQALLELKPAEREELARIPRIAAVSPVLDVRAGESLPLQQVRAYVGGRSKVPAVVADVGWVNGLGAIRSLGRAGVPVIALDRHGSALGFRSRYAFGVVCPDPVENEERFGQLLVALGDGLGAAAPIFPTHDEELAAVARAAPVLGERFLYPFPPWEKLEWIQRKRVQLEEAEAAGVPIPQTAYPGSAAEASAAAESMGYPVLVKPSDPIGFRRRFRRQAFRCASRAEVDSAYSESEEFAPMVQELIPGGDDELYTLGSYVAADGEALGLFSGRKLRQTPPVVGTCRVGEAVWVQDVVDQGLRLLARLGFHGLSQVEFKRDPRDGRFKLMEVNPRLWQWHSLATACGVDLVRIAYRDLLGDRPAPTRRHADGKRWAITFMAGDGPAIPRPPYTEAVLALDDPRPWLAQVARLARRAVR